MLLFLLFLFALPVFAQCSCFSFFSFFFSFFLVALLIQKERFLFLETGSCGQNDMSIVGFYTILQFGSALENWKLLLSLFRTVVIG